MVDDFSINGTLINSYLICKREAWLQARRVIPPQDHPLLEIGRIVSEYSYQRDLKNIILDDIEIDIVKKEDEEILIGEVKKSSKAEDVARLQLLFYIWKVEQLGVKASGILLFPKEKKRISVDLTDKDKLQLNQLVEAIKNLVSEPSPPPVKKIPYCKNCAYKEMCFA